MVVVVGKVVGWANDSHIQTIDVDSLADTRIEDRVFCLRVSAHKDQKISLINTNDSRVHEILASKVTVNLSLIASHINVLAVETVQEIFEGYNRLDILELSDHSLNLFTLDTRQLFSGLRHSLLPVKLRVGSISFTSHWDGESLLFKTVKSMTRFVRDPLLIDFFVDAWEDSKKVSTSSVSINVGTHSIHAVDGVVALEFPGAGLEGVGQVVEGADRA